MSVITLSARPFCRSVQSSRRPVRIARSPPHITRRNLIFFVHRSRRCHPKASPHFWTSQDRSSVYSKRHNEAKTPHFHPWGSWKQTAGASQEWLFKWNYSHKFKDEDPRERANAYMDEMIARMSERKGHYMNRVSQIEGRFNDIYRWANQWSDSARKEANSLHASLMKRMYEMSKPYVTEDKATHRSKTSTKSRQSEPPTNHYNKTASLNATEATSEEINAVKIQATQDIQDETEIDYITLKRVPKQKVEPLSSATPTLIDALQNEGTRTSFSKLEQDEILDAKTSNVLPLDPPTSTAKDALQIDSSDKISQNQELISGLESIIYVNPPQDTASELGGEKGAVLTAGDETLGEISTADSVKDVTEDGHPESASRSNINIYPGTVSVGSDPKSSSQFSPLPNSEVLSAAGTIQDSGEAAVLGQSDQAFTADALPKLSPADLIASLRYYDRNRGRLPDEEPLSTQDIAFLEATRDKLAKELEARLKRGSSANADSTPGKKSRTKQIGIAIGSAVIATYVVGVGSKLFSAQSDSTAAAELLSAVQRSRETKI
ncbi:hypothetical protein ABW19_dt0202681 [Dactylella cylindrospora]|nr:hypothetical protein ABW19_dt0202681 [Dactylella cylindrospora]